MLRGVAVALTVLCGLAGCVVDQGYPQPEFPQELNDAVDRDPRDIGALMARAAARLEGGWMQHAANDYAAVLDVQWNHRSARVGRAHALLHQMRLDEAAAELQAAFDVDASVDDMEPLIPVVAHSLSPDELSAEERELAYADCRAEWKLLLDRAPPDASYRPWLEAFLGE